MAKSLNRIRVRCVQCQAGLEARRSEIGTKIRCPYCHAAQTVPSESRPDIVDEGYAVVASDAPPAASAEHYVSIVCTLCGTRLHGTREQIGEIVTCPDCGTVSVLKPPPEAATPQGDTSEPVAVGQYDVCQGQGVGQGQGQPARDNAVVYRRYIPLVCKLCQTRLLATEDEVGRPIVCPDCRTENIVPAAQPETVVDAATPPGEYGISASPNADSSPRFDDLFPFTCPRCQTRLHAHRRETGAQTTCPDCRTRFTIPQPPPSIEPLRDEPADIYGVRAAEGVPPESQAADAPRTSEPPRRQASAPPRAAAGLRAAPAPRPNAASRPPLPPIAPGAVVSPEGALAPIVAPSQSTKARRIRNQRRRERIGAAPKHPFLQGVWGFPFSRGVLVFWVTTSGWIFLTLEMLVKGLSLASDGDPRAKFVGMILIAGVCLLSFIGLVGVAGYWLAILHDTAAGNKTIENWPEMVLADWSLGFLHLIVAAGCAVGIGTILRRFAEPMGVAPAAVLALSMHVLFPLFLLSSLETNVPFLPVSLPILRSLRNSFFAWVAFYTLTGLLVPVGYATAMLCLRWAHLWTLAPASAILAAIAILYFRLLGRLALCCVNRARQADADAEDDETDQRHDS